MKEKIDRFIKAFQMNGEVKKKTLLYGGIALVVLLVALLLILSGCENKPVDTPDDQGNNPGQEDIVNPGTEEPPTEEPNEMAEIMKKYPHVYAWLEIPGTAEVLGIESDVSYPVAQHPTDRLFYIDHDLDGNKYQPGTLFTEAEVEGVKANGKDLNDPVTVIYGHNQANRTMFGGLQSYMAKMKYADPQVVHMYQEGRVVTYQIVGGVQYDTSHILYYHDFCDEAVFNEFFSQQWKETDSTTNLDKENMPKFGDKVLILSVCKNGDDYHRYLVVCKQIADEKLEG